MQPISIIAVLCEDVRDEIGGLITLVGVMQDNASINPQTEKSDPLQKVLNKLSIFIRATFDPDDKIPTIKFRLVMPDSTSLDIGEAGADVIAQAQVQAKEKGNPIAGTISRAILLNFHLPKPGVLRVEADVRDETRIIGILNFMVAPEAPIATVSSIAH